MDKSKLVETFIGSRPAFEGRLLRLTVDTVRLPNGMTAEREVVAHPGAVAVLPVLDDGRVVLVAQYRHAVRKILWEVPAGKLDAGESPDACAVRELEEETGYRAQQMERLGAVFTTPGFSDEVIHIYRASGLCFTAQHTDDDEFIETASFSPAAIKSMVKAGEICDAKTLNTFYLAGMA